jgi:mono/diheme cytochrome c family protein
MRRRLAPLLLLPLLGGAASAASYQLPPETAVLRPAEGKGFEAAQNHCLACHSADYPNMQPPNKPKPFWEAIVTKMIQVYKAQIAEEDAKAIAQYLADNY